MQYFSFGTVVQTSLRSKDKMGGSQSSDNAKATDIETTGQVNNSFVVKSPMDVQSTEILVILTILCVLRVLEVAYGMYAACKRRIKNHIREGERIRLHQTQTQRRPHTPRATPRADGSNNV